MSSSFSPNESSLLKRLLAFGESPPLSVFTFGEKVGIYALVAGEDSYCVGLASNCLLSCSAEIMLGSPTNAFSLF